MSDEAKARLHVMTMRLTGDQQRIVSAAITVRQEPGQNQQDALVQLCQDYLDSIRREATQKGTQ